MKTIAPRSLHGSDLRQIMGDLQATPREVSKFLRVGERTVWRWLANEDAPYAALAALWHETPQGHYETGLDLGNEAQVWRSYAKSLETRVAVLERRLAHVLEISDTGALNAPVFESPRVSGAF